MPCFKPQYAWQTADGTVHWKQAPHNFVRGLTLPCGKCQGCIETSAQEWALRCMHEYKMKANYGCFITLTYKDPGQITLSVNDWQLFMKRLRKAYPDRHDIKFLMCGEYGPKTHRPHYHAVIMGWRPGDEKEVVRRKGTPAYKSKMLDKLWGHGITELADITQKTAAYCARYSRKNRKPKPHPRTQQYEEFCPYTGEIKTVIPEFGLMSRNPGLGSTWYDKFKNDVFPHDYVPGYGGRKQKTPRYYTNKLKTQKPQEYDIVRNARYTRAQTPQAIYNNSKERLATRERLAIYKAKKFAKEVI